MVGLLVGAHRPAHREHGVELAPIGKRFALVELDRDGLHPRASITSEKTPGGSQAMCWSTSSLIAAPPSRSLGHSASQLVELQPDGLVVVPPGGLLLGPLRLLGVLLLVLGHLAGAGVDLDHGERGEQVGAIAGEPDRPSTARRTRTACG